MSSLDDQFAHMATGAMYDDLTTELTDARRRAVLATTEYNAAYGESQDVREALLRAIVGSAGAGANLEPSFRCEFGRNIHIGERFFANFDAVMLDGAPITIGDDVLFGPRASLYTSNHAFDPDQRAAGACYARPITIGHRVWLCGDVTITPGVTIGDDTIIGAGSVVTHDIPPRVIAAGNPARVLRDITAADRTSWPAN